MTARNMLWIMCDQLRFDYLSCAGHRSLATPNIDRLAARGVRFTRAYVQSPVCGPSRMSFYTGRYMRSHGANWNQFPLRVDEPTLGDALKALGVRNVLVGKTHMRADEEGLDRLGIDRASDIGVHVSQCGFEPFERDDGLHPTASGGGRTRYDDHLRERGFGGANPWEDWANAGEADGRLASGWLLAHADKAARVDEPESETPYMTRRAMEFIAGAARDGRPWCLHLSYIKPHWPYIAPAPYHALYGPGDVQPPVRDAAERRDPHPVYAAFMDLRVSRNMARDEVRSRVVPAYMGLIKQIDDQLGLLFAFLDREGLAETTLVAFTSDHGDYLGDHWLGEKDLFHDCSVRVPLIVVDPSPAADATRGSTCDRLVEAIDLAPTIVDWFGGRPRPNVMEGRSLLPLLHGHTDLPWRRYTVSEYDFSMLEVREALGLAPRDSRLFMLFDGRWKLVHAPGFRPMLFDLAGDPDELQDLGADPARAPEVARLKDHLLDWALRDHARVTMDDEAILAYGPGPQLESGVIIGYTDEAEVAQARADYGLD
jgi:arylsulfatase A-like enzyme